MIKYQELKKEELDNILRERKISDKLTKTEKMLLEKIKKIQKNVEEISVEKSKTLKNIIEELYMQNNLK